MELRGLTSGMFLVEMLVTLLLMSASGINGILDFTCFNSKPRIVIDGDNDMFIGGFKSGDDTDAVVSFGRTSNTGTSDGLDLPNGSERSGALRANPVRQYMRVGGGVQRIGAFYCNANNGVVDEKITTIIMSFPSTIKPIEISQTVNVGQQVTFMVDTNIDNTRWRHNGGDVISDLNGQKVYTIDNVDVCDAGVYECHQESKRDQGVHAIFLLVVRRCEQNKWNIPNCDQDCHYCFNGGICDERSGECVCAPGFSGQNCTTVHGRNIWGQSGKLRCSGTSDHGDGCLGRLFCLPHPYGCSCAAGYKGLDCNQECSPGTFGANCRSECHCKPGVSCLADTGECDGGECADGWSGVNCQQGCGVTGLRYILLENSIVVTWEPVGNLCIGKSFRVEKMRTRHGQCAVESISQVETVETTTSTSSTIPQISYDSTYQVFVSTVLGSSSFGQRQGTNTIRTPWFVPIFKPSITSSLAEDEYNGLSFEWDAVPCDMVGGTGLRYEYQWWDASSNIVSTNMTTETRVKVDNLIECKSYSFHVRVVNDFAEGPWSELATVSTRTISPGPVNDLDAFDQSSTGLSLSWSQSDANNCNEDNYIIQYKVINNDRCMAVEGEWESTDMQTQFTTTLSDLVPYTTYKVSVTTYITDGNFFGPPIEVVSNTTILKPSGPPDNIVAQDITPNAITFTWTQPKCGERRGEIIAYSYTLTDSKDNEFESGNISETSVHFDGLEPFTNYTFSISALTEKGSGPYVQLDVITEEAAPSAPTNLRLKNITRTSMTATWGLPNYPNGILTKYTVQYHVTAKPYDLSFEPVLMSDIESIDVSADYVEYVIDNLVPSTEYRVVVTAYSVKGAGDESAVTEFTGLASSEDIPEPRKLSNVGKITPTTVEIQIQLSDSSFVTSYQIMVKMQGLRKRRAVTEYIAAELLKASVESNPKFVVGDDKTYGIFHNTPLTRGQTYTLYTGAVSRINDTTFAVVWSEGVDVSITPNTDLSAALTSIIIVLGCMLIVMFITILFMALKIRSLMQIIKMLQKENSQLSKKSKTNTTHVTKSTDDPGTNNTDEISMSADGYVEYKVTKNDESAYQDLDNTPTNRQIDDGEEYAYVNNSIVRSHTTERVDGNYESIK